MKLGYTPSGYWERRYRDGRSSGAGSEGQTAIDKAEYVNHFIQSLDVESVIDWGVGDGTVLDGITRGVRYLGLDVSETIVDRLRRRYASAPLWDFEQVTEHYDAPYDLHELSLSMDVLFHLVDDRHYWAYLNNLFGHASRYVIIYSTNYGPERTARHVLRRRFTPDIASSFPDWELLVSPKDPMVAGFYVYGRS